MTDAENIMEKEQLSPIFKVGDKCWTWSLTVFGAYIPFFDQYQITSIIHQANLSFVYLSHDVQVDMVIPLHLVFKEKHEAIEALISLLNKIKLE